MLSAHILVKVKHDFKIKEAIGSVKKLARQTFIYRLRNADLFQLMFTLPQENPYCKTNHDKKPSANGGF